MDAWIILSDIVILLAGALVLGGFFSWLGLSPLIGYLLAGMILGGPGSIQAIGSQMAIEAIAELGVSLLLFALALEFSFAELRKLGAKILFAGAIQIILTAAVGTGAGLLFGLGVKEALAVGAMISLSSTAVVLRVLVERGEGESAHGRNALGVLLVQDMAVVPLAVLVVMLGTQGTASDMSLHLGKILGLALGLTLLLYLFNKVAVFTLRIFTLERNRELSILLAVVMGLGSAWAAHQIGISPALGAFVAGMFLGNSPFATQIRADVSALRVILLTLFFGSVGMVADPTWIVSHWYFVLMVLVLLTVVKGGIVWGIFQMIGQRPSVAAATGVCLAQIGEFAFVIGNLASANGVLAADTQQLVVSVAILSLLASALLIPSASSISDRLTGLLGYTSLIHDPNMDVRERPPDIVFIGFGPAAQIAAGAFEDNPKRVLVIDLNRDGINRAKAMGLCGLVGDATQPDVLQHAQVPSASAVVITNPNHQTAYRVLELIRQLAPHAHVMVRSRYQRHEAGFTQLGANNVVGDEEMVGEALRKCLEDWCHSSDRKELYDRDSSLSEREA